MFQDTVAALSLYRVGSKASTHSNDEHIKDDQSNGKVVMGIIITNDNQDGLCHELLFSFYCVILNYIIFNTAL